MHGLVDAKPLDIRPVQTVAPLAGHFLGPEDGLEGDELGARAETQSPNNLAQRHADPRDHHGPSFDAAKPVDPFFQAVRRNQVVNIVDAGVFHRAFDRNGPGPWLEIARILGRIFLAGAEFVEIVVGGDAFEGCRILVRAVGALGDAHEFWGRYAWHAERRCEHETGGRCAGRAYELAAVQVNGFGRDLRRPGLAHTPCPHQHIAFLRPKTCGMKEPCRSSDWLPKP